MQYNPDRVTQGFAHVCVKGALHAIMCISGLQGRGTRTKGLATEVSFTMLVVTQVL